MTSVRREYSQRNSNVIEVLPVLGNVQAYNYAYYTLNVNPIHTQTFTVDLLDLEPSRTIAVQDESGNLIGSGAITNYFRFYLEIGTYTATNYPGLEFTVVFKPSLPNSRIQMVSIPISEESYLSPKPSDSGFGSFTSLSITYRSDGTAFKPFSSSPTFSPYAEFWVAGGDYINNEGQTIAHSYDGITWAYSNNTPLKAFCKTIKYNGKMWVAGGTSTPDNNPLIYSYDGITWLPSENGNEIFPSGHYSSPNYKSYNGGCSSLAWNGTMWVAVGGGSTPLAYSYDGITWTVSPSTNIFGYEGYDTCIAWNGSMWLAGACGSNSLAYSLDGINWTGLGEPCGYNKVFAAAWNGSMWVIGSGSSAANNNRLAWSTDGINWTQSTNGANLMLRIYSIAWNGTLWVACGDGVGANSYNPLIYSADGKNWFLSANGTDAFKSGSNTPNGCYSVAWNGSLWVAGGANAGDENGWIAYSKDGIHWTPSNNAAKNGSGDYLFNYYCFTIATRSALPYN